MGCGGRAASVRFTVSIEYEIVEAVEVVESASESDSDSESEPSVVVLVVDEAEDEREGERDGGAISTSLVAARASRVKAVSVA